MNLKKRVATALACIPGCSMFCELRGMRLRWEHRQTEVRSMYRRLHRFTEQIELYRQVVLMEVSSDSAHKFFNQ